MKLSKQAMGAIMMALQKSMLEQADIVPILEKFNFRMDEEECLEILNPPNFKIGNDFFEPESVNTTGSD